MSVTEPRHSDVSEPVDPSPLLSSVGSFHIVTPTTEQPDGNKQNDEKTHTPEFTYFYVGVAMFAITIGGLSPGLERELQVRSNLPGTLIITARNMFTILLLSWTIPTNYRGMRRFQHIPLFAFLRVCLPLTKVYAARFAFSYYVQTVQLLAPFVVAAISFVLRDPIPKYTIPALVAVTIGTFLTVAGTALAGGHISFSSDNLIGIALAFGTAIISASSFVMYSKFPMTVSSKAVFWLSAAFQFIVIAPISLSIDNWNTSWKKLDRRGLLEFFGYVFGPYLGGDGLQVLVIRRIGAPLYAALSAWKGVVALIFGSVVLHEPAHVLNIIGVIIVTVTVAAYLFAQHKIKLQLDKIAGNIGRQENKTE